MNILFTKDGFEDYLYWQKTDERILRKINELIKACRAKPFSGIGKPEALKFDMSGYWSRRIDIEHRLVYKFENKTIIIIQCRYHY